MSLQLPKNRNSFGYDHLRSFQIGGQVEETTAEQDPTKLIYILYSFLASGKQPKSGEPDDILALLQENEAQTDTFEKEFEAKSPEELQQDKKFMEFYAKFQPEQDQAAYLAKGSKIKQLRTIKKAAPIKGKETSTKAAGGNVGTYPGVSLNGPTITAKAKVKPTYTTGQVTLTKTVPNKSVDIGVRSANSHQEKTTATQRVLTKAKGAKLVKKGGKKKCSCGCEMVLSKAAGGKVIETCACKCGGKMKKKK